MSNNPAIYEVPTKQYLRSILDISVRCEQTINSSLNYFLPSNPVKLENVDSSFSRFSPLLSYLSVATPVRFRMARQLLGDFKFIPTPSLDFRVALKKSETAP